MDGAEFAIGGGSSVVEWREGTRLLNRLKGLWEKSF